MTDKITVPRETWDAMREALEEYLNKDNVELQLNGIKSKAIEALTAANAVSNQDLPIGKCGVLSKSEPQAQRELEEWLDANRMQAIGSLHHELVARFTAHPQATEPQYSIDADPQGIRARVVSAVVGAMAYGASNNNKPPEGHWLNEVWDIALAEANRVQPQAQGESYSERWYGSGEDRGWWIVRGGLVKREHVAFLGESVSSEEVSKVVAELNAAHPQATEPAWRLIESAPKSGSFLVGVWEGDWKKPKQRFVIYQATGWPSGPLWAMKGNYRTEEGGAYKLACWMPLPAAPEAKQ